ncbi:nuclear protein DGCR14 [Melanogaster broomeanus]|nr:nuclear protein DGCR14 [Melanogaster broomeanus]
MSTPEAGPSSTAPKRSLNRQEILDEDEYTAALSHIIARDFFPSLVHLDATNDYLEALRSNDAEPHYRLPHLATPLDGGGRRPLKRRTAPAPGPPETPLRTPREVGEPAAKRPRFDADMSLDVFQAKYTSEDNASFTQIMHEENRQRRDKWGWAWEAQKRVEAMRDKMLEGRERMLIEQPSAPGVREKVTIEAPTVAGLITASGESSGQGSRASNAEEKGKELVAVKKSTSEEETDVMAPRKDTRPAGVDAWRFKTRNSLMFPPDADVSPYDPSTSTIIVKAKVDPKVIKHGNTRLLEQDDADKSRSLSAPPSPTHSRIDAAITGTPYRPRSPSASGFSLVPNTRWVRNAVKQLMTWGTLNATPRIISQSDDPAEEMPPPTNTFHISAPSSREALSHRLSANAAKSLRAKAGLLSGSTPLLGRTPSRTPAKGSMAPPSLTPRRADAPGNLTPAARRLLDRTAMSTAAARRAEAMGKVAGKRKKDLNHVRWTPTPVTRRG